MSRFLRILLFVTAVAHVPVWLAVFAFARRFSLPLPWLCATLFAGFGIALFVGRARGGMPDHRRSSALVRFVDVPYFTHWCGAICSIIPSALYLVVAAFLWVIARTPLSFGFFMWTYGLSLLLAGYGVLIRRRWFQVVRLELPVRDLPKEFDGYRIAHLSDLHIGSVTPKSWGDRWVRAANREKVDLAVVTGDMVTSGVDFHGDIADVLGNLSAPDGTVVSMGNHDYFGDGEPLISLLRGKGVHVFRNEGRVIQRGNRAIYLAAIDDTWTRRDDLGRALSARPNDAATILLAHDPERFPQAAAENVDIVLSGHTHAGQIAVPFLSRYASLAHIAHNFRVGVYRRGSSTLYVSPGLGTTGPPIRVGAAPAIAILTLRRA